MVKKIAISLILLPLLVLVLSPKKELLFLLEKRLASQGIVLADGSITTHPFGLTLEHPSLYVKGIKVATIRHLSVWSVLFFTRGSAEGITVDDAFTAYVPAHLTRITVTHRIVDPIRVHLRVEDPAIQGEGAIALGQRSVSVRFTKFPSGISAVRYLKHTKGGWVYAQRF